MRIHGLIPAHAGKTPLTASLSISRPAHPRSRGENSYAATIAAMFAGSSPLTRGKPPDLKTASIAPGLIPAHAGKTYLQRLQRSETGAHPRSRGENTSRTTPMDRRWGSSPLTRGKPRRLAPWLGCPRLIPAHAGKTPPKRLTRTSSPAHPRSRGENVLAAPMIVLIWGSSPLTRGKQH